MESVELLSRTNKRRVQNLRAVAARYEQQTDMAAKLGWSASYLSQLIGPNPSRPITEKTARQVETKLGLEAGYLDGEAPPPEVSAAISGDLLDNVMLTVDSALRVQGWKLSEEKYRALVSYLYKSAARRGDRTIERGEVESLLNLVR